jgi:hypothetical protein
MNLISTTDKRGLPFRTPAMEDSIDGRTQLRARLHRAQHWAAAIEKVRGGRGDLQNRRLSPAGNRTHRDRAMDEH